MIKFDATIAQPSHPPHLDPLVVTIKIGQMKVMRVLVDSGSITDLITMNSLNQMKFEEKNIYLVLTDPSLALEVTEIYTLEQSYFQSVVAKQCRFASPWSTLIFPIMLLLEFHSSKS